MLARPAVLLTPLLSLRPAQLPSGPQIASESHQIPLFVFRRLHTLSFSVSRNSFPRRSYENCRGVHQQFPFWNDFNRCELEEALANFLKYNRGWGYRVCVATRLDAAPILAGEEERGMANFLEYNPEQAYLLPPTVREVLGEGHLCFFVHGAVEKLDLQEFEAGYSDEGHPAYHPALLLKVWLYAYALGMTSSRRLEQRIREALAFRYLAGGAQPDFWALNQFPKRHGRAMNDIFTQVVELARPLGLAELGPVAIDSTRLPPTSSASCKDSPEKLRAERGKIRTNLQPGRHRGASQTPT